MSQTMLALLALMLASLFAVQQQRQTAEMRLAMIRSEVSTQSTGVAVDRLEEIGSMSFDEATIGNETLSAVDSLTAGPPFGSDAPGNDIDDFDGVTVDTFRVAGTQQLNFRMTSRVRYASEASFETEVASRTKVKKVTVKVFNLDIPNPDTVTISQSYVCGSRCNW